MVRSIPISLVLLAFGLGAAPLAAADLEAGREVARKCTVCHGKDGIASDPEVPNLAGQSAFYLEKALKEYRDGTRQDRRMTIMAEPLSDEDIRAVSAWYEAFTLSVTPPGD